MLRIFKQDFGITQVQRCDPSFAVFVDGLCDHGERVGTEIAASARFVQFRCVGKVVHPAVCAFKQEKAISSLAFTVRENAAFNRADVPPLRCAQMKALVRKQCSVRGKRLLVIGCPLHRSQHVCKIPAHVPFGLGGGLGETHPAQRFDSCLYRLLPN